MRVFLSCQLKGWFLFHRKLKIFAGIKDGTESAEERLYKIDRQERKAKIEKQ